MSVAATQLQAGLAVIDLLVDAGLATSKGEARRLIRGGGAKVNDVAVTDEGQSVSMADVSDRGDIKLSAGKKRHALVKPN